MKKFEYYVLYGHRSDDDTYQTLDELGNDGWEAYAVVPTMSGIEIYLKREKPT